MHSAHLADWLEFGIPFLSIFLSGSARQIIERKRLLRRFFLGLDLTLFFLNACLLNVVALTKGPGVINTDGLLRSAGLVAVAMTTFVFQIVLHQGWEAEGRSTVKQVVVLCFCSNGIGLLLIYGFVRFKLRGYI